jgi:hypothetical protein
MHCLAQQTGLVAAIDQHVEVLIGKIRTFSRRPTARTSAICL